MIDIKNNRGQIKVHLLTEDESGSASVDAVPFVPLNEGSIHHAELMNNDYIELKFSLDKPILLKRGAFVELENRKYILCEPFYPTYSNSTGGYEYKLRFDAWFYSWNRYILKLNPAVNAAETTFDYTCRLGDHCELLYRAIQELKKEDASLVVPNEIIFKVHMDSDGAKGEVRTYAYDSSEAWKYSKDEEDRIVGQNTNYVKDEAKVVSYQGIHIIDAFTSIAETFECEWWVEEISIAKVVFHFGRCEQMAQALTDWRFNEDITETDANEIASMSRSESRDDYATRVYAYGSTTNVPARYRKKLVFTATEKSSQTTSEEAWQYVEGQSISFSQRTTATEEQLITVTKTVTLPTFEAAFDGVQHVIIEIPFIATFERLERFDQSASTAKINGTSLTISTNNSARVISIFGTFTATKGAVCTLVMELAALLYGNNAYARAEVNLGKVSIRFSGGKVGNYILMRDQTRLMYPPYFLSDARETQEAKSFVFGEPGKDQVHTAKDGKSGEVGLYDAIRVDSSTKVKIDWNIDFMGIILEGGEDATLTLDVVAYLDDTEVVGIGTKTYTYKGGAWVDSKNEYSAFIGESIRSFDRDGQLSFGVRWTCSVVFTPTFKNMVNAAESLTFVVIPQNSKVNTEMEVLSGTYQGVKIPCMLNVAMQWDTNNAASWLAFDSSASINGVSIPTIIDEMVSKTNQFKLANVKEIDTPISYFTNEDDQDTTISGFKRRIMLPISTCPKNFVEVDVDPSEIVETEVVFDNIYPSMNLTIEKVEEFLLDEDITDDDGHKYKVKKPWYRFYIGKDKFPFKTDYISSQATLSCFFASGLLAGMTFELKFEGDTKETYVNEMGETCILQSYVINKKNEGNIDLPNPTLMPKKGNEVAMINYDATAIGNLNLVADAEQRLYKEALNYLEKVSKDCGTYTIVLNSEYVYDGAKSFGLGHRIRITHGGYFEGTRSTRVIGYEVKLDIPYDAPQYTLGESAAYSRLSDIESKLNAGSASSSTSIVNYGVGGDANAYSMFFSVGSSSVATFNPYAGNMALSFKAGKGIVITPNENDHSITISSNGAVEGNSSLFDELFEKVTLEDGTTAIKAKYGLFSVGFISAYGENQNGGGSSGSGYQRLDSIKDYSADKDTTHVLGAKVANEIKNIEARVENLETNPADSDKHLVINHQVAEKVWNVTHNLGKRPSVTVVTSDGVCVVGEVRYIDENSLTLTFGCEFSGKVILN